MIFYEKGSQTTELSPEEIKQAIFSALEQLGEKKRVVAVPPDFTRFNSRAGEITSYCYGFYKDKMSDVLPALGTHNPMTKEQIDRMFPGVPQDLFRIHDWRNDVVTVGEVPAEFVKEVSEGAVDFTWPAQVNKLLLEEDIDLILSIGQVVPHEVVGMANYNKNIFVGTGGSEGINKSHYVGAAYGMERMMGHADTPVRRIFNYASDNFTADLPILYVQTVIGKGKDGELKLRGLYIGDDLEVFTKAAKLSLEVNFEMLDKPLNKVIVYLDPEEFNSTWLGNKSVYRTRMAIDDGGELIVIAPKLVEFGEDKEIDKLIRKYGYCGTENTLEFVKKNEDLGNNLSAAAHLIHGSSEGRFSVTYCPGKEKGNLSKEEIESVHFLYGDIDEVMEKYDFNNLKDGYNTVNGEEVFYISNPALGLWAFRERFSY